MAQNVGLLEDKKNEKAFKENWFCRFGNCYTVIN